jgi:signal transduction histidine kinase
LKEGHLGLVGMDERAQMFNGRIYIQTFQGKGTTIIMELDLDHS